MNASNIPLGPIGQILVVHESGVVGRCIGAFWPFSRFAGFTVKLQTTNGGILELPLTSVRDATPQECTNFETQRWELGRRFAERASVF